MLAGKCVAHHDPLQCLRVLEEPVHDRSGHMASQGIPDQDYPERGQRRTGLVAELRPPGLGGQFQIAAQFDPSGGGSPAAVSRGVASHVTMEHLHTGGATFGRRNNRLPCSAPE